MSTLKTPKVPKVPSTLGAPGTEVKSRRRRGLAGLEQTIIVDQLRRGQRSTPPTVQINQRRQRGLRNVERSIINEQVNSGTRDASTVYASNDDSLRVAGFRQPSLSDSVSAIVTLSPNPDIDVTLDDSVSIGNIPQTPSFGLSPIPTAHTVQSTDTDLTARTGIRKFLATVPSKDPVAQSQADTTARTAIRQFLGSTQPRQLQASENKPQPSVRNLTSGQAHDAMGNSVIGKRASSAYQAGDAVSMSDVADSVDRMTQTLKFVSYLNTLTLDDTQDPTQTVQANLDAFASHQKGDNPWDSITFDPDNLPRQSVSPGPFDPADFGNDAPGPPPGTQRPRPQADQPQPSPTQAPAPQPTNTAGVSRQRVADTTKVRIDLADQLKRDPGILKLVEKKVLSYSDFLTDGMLDYAKLAQARRSLIDQVESTETSYKLAAMAKGYAPSGAAYPIKGLNTVVGGVRQIPGTKYVIYSGPRYADV